MLKKDLRNRFLELRQNVSTSAVNKASFRISEHAKTLPVWDLLVFHIYLHSDQKKEISTQPLIHMLRERNKQIVVPRISPSNELRHFLLSENTELKPNRWGIPEPVAGKTVSPAYVDVVFVPLLAFDLKGQRVGYGKGYYDRFLAECRKDCLKVGLSFYDPVDEIKDPGEHDIPLDYCLTPARVYSFGPAS